MSEHCILSKGCPYGPLAYAGHFWLLVSSSQNQSQSPTTLIRSRTC